MGKGDRKTRRGKIYSGSYGKVRLQGEHSALGSAVGTGKTDVKKAAPKKKAG